MVNLIEEWHWFKMSRKLSADVLFGIMVKVSSTNRITRDKSYYKRQIVNRRQIVLQEICRRHFDHYAKQNITIYIFLLFYFTILLIMIEARSKRRVLPLVFIVNYKDHKNSLLIV